MSYNKSQQIEKTEIIKYMWYDQHEINGIGTEYNYRNLPNVWKLGTAFINNTQVNEEIIIYIRKYIEQGNNKSTA